MRKHSFTEYVADKFDTQLFYGVDKYIKENYKSMRLRLNKIRNIESIEVSDTRVKFVNVTDLPGMQIEFNVVVESELEIQDTDYRFEVERCYQWFMLKCSGSLDCDLIDFNIINVSEYYNKGIIQNPLSDNLVPIINPEKLESVANDFLQKYYPEVLKKPMYLDPFILANNMRLNVKLHKITQDSTIFGQIYFHPCDTELYDEDIDKIIQTKIESGTILVDPRVYFLRNVGSVNNTIVHECVHWDKHRKAFELHRLYNSEYSKINCQVIGGIRNNNREAIEWMECQANTLTPKIQMPLEMFKAKAEELIYQFSFEYNTFELIDLMESVINELASFFGVSRAAAKIRMIEAGYEEAIGTFTYIDGRYVKPHSFKKGEIKNHQTFSISAQDAAILSKTDFNLNALIGDGSYQYVEAHFVLNHPKYLTQDENGETILTRYARTHMDECCLIFDLSVISGCSTRYYNECFLNRDNSSGIDFNIFYKGGYEFADKEKKNKILKEIIEEEAKLYNTLPNCYRESLKKAFEWKGITYTDLEKKTGVSEKTIRRIINGETKGTCESLVLICLGLHLPPKISRHIIQNSPCPLCNGNSDHDWYDFALTHLYSKSIEEIKAFFNEHGVKQL